jgi:hypothetical protein
LGLDEYECECEGEEKGGLRLLAGCVLIASWTSSSRFSAISKGAPNLIFKFSYRLNRTQESSDKGSIVTTMVFTLGTLFEAGLLLINAVAILNDEKFLKKGIIIK